MTVTAVPPQSGEKAAEAAPPRSRKKLMIIVVAVLLLGGGGGSWFLRPKDSAPEPGEVLPLEAVQVNLASGHYLRLGLALQLTADAHELDGSKALDAAITVFSGLPVEEVNQPKAREKHRAELMHLLEERYHGDVMEVYFTEFVTQ